MKEGYFYETIGGNNLREAYKQLLEEQPKLKKVECLHINYALCTR